MKTILTASAILLGFAALILIGVPCLFLWAVGKAGREEKAACDRQMEDDRLSCGPIEED